MFGCGHINKLEFQFKIGVEATCEEFYVDKMGQVFIFTPFLIVHSVEL